MTPGEARRAEQLRVLGHAEHIWSADGNSYALVARGVPAAELDTASPPISSSATGAAVTAP